MGIRSIRCPPLATMTNRAAIARRIVDDVGVTTEKPIPFDAALARRHADVATHASIRRTNFAADDLAKLNGEGVGLGRWQLRCNVLLNDAPIAEEVFLHRRPGQYCERHQARPEKKMFVGFHNNLRMLIRMRLFQTFKPFNRFAPFKPPPLSSPATVGEDYGGGRDGLNGLNDWNDLNHFLFLVSRPLRRRPIKIPVRSAKMGSDHCQHYEAADKTSEQSQCAGTRRVVFF
jgi:hypothetical protein